MNKIQKLEYAYNKACETISLFPNYIGVIHVEYKSLKYIVANIIKLAAFIKGRRNKIAHTAILFYDNKIPFVIEQSSIRGGIVKRTLKDSYFTKSFKGNVTIDFIECKNFDKAKAEKYINDKLGEKYSIKSMFLSWFDLLFSSDNGTKSELCTDFALDYVDKMLGYKFVDYPNNEITPAELFFIIGKKIEYFKENIKRVSIFRIKDVFKDKRDN